MELVVHEQATQLIGSDQQRRLQTGAFDRDWMLVRDRSAKDLGPPLTHVGC